LQSARRFLFIRQQGLNAVASGACDYERRERDQILRLAQIPAAKKGEQFAVVGALTLSPTYEVMGQRPSR
jgi:hypothetical protein